jgi:hypothetical protein
MVPIYTRERRLSSRDRVPEMAALSAGLVCFKVRGLPAQEVVERFAARGIVATVRRTRRPTPESGRAS